MKRQTLVYSLVSWRKLWVTEIHKVLQSVTHPRGEKNPILIDSVMKVKIKKGLPISIFHLNQQILKLYSLCKESPSPVGKYQNSDCLCKPVSHSTCTCIALQTFLPQPHPILHMAIALVSSQNEQESFHMHGSKLFISAILDVNLGFMYLVRSWSEDQASNFAAWV